MSKVHINWYGEDEVRHKLQGLFRETVYGNFLDVKNKTVSEVRDILNINFPNVEEGPTSYYDGWFIIHAICKNKEG